MRKGRSTVPYLHRTSIDAAVSCIYVPITCVLHTSDANGPLHQPSEPHTGPCIPFASCADWPLSMSISPHTVLLLPDMCTEVATQTLPPVIKRLRAAIALNVMSWPLLLRLPHLCLLDVLGHPPAKMIIMLFSTILPVCCPVYISPNCSCP